MRSAPTLKIWMTPLASVAMLEKLALLKIALCRAPALINASSASLPAVLSAPSETPISVLVSAFLSVMVLPLGDLDVFDLADRLHDFKIKLRAGAQRSLAAHAAHKVCR